MLVFSGLYVKFLSGTTFWAIVRDNLSVTDSRVSEVQSVSCKETNCTVYIAGCSAKELFYTCQMQRIVMCPMVLQCWDVSRTHHSVHPTGYSWLAEGSARACRWSVAHIPAPSGTIEWSWHPSTCMYTLLFCTILYICTIARESDILEGLASRMLQKWIRCIVRLRCDKVQACSYTIKD